MRHIITTLSLSLLSGLLTVSAHTSGLVPILISSADATVAYRATIESLTEQADLIVHARVERQWTPKKRGPQGQIYTYTQLATVAVWSGEVRAPLLLVQLGGQIDDLQLKVHGDAELKVGQEVVLFLTSERGDLPPVTAQATVEISDVSRPEHQGYTPAQNTTAESGTSTFQVVHLVSLAQGAFHLERSAQGDLKLRQHLEGLVFYDASPKHLKYLTFDPKDHTAEHQHDHAKAEELWSLQSLRRRVTSLKRGGQ